MCICVCVHPCHSTYLEIRHISRNQFSPSPMLVPLVKLISHLQSPGHLTLTLGRSQYPNSQQTMWKLHLSPPTAAPQPSGPFQADLSFLQRKTEPYGTSQQKQQEWDFQYPQPQAEERFQSLDVPLLYTQTVIWGSLLLPILKPPTSCLLSADCPL